MTVERDPIFRPPATTSIHLFVDPASVGPVLGWLAQQCCISPGEITSWIGPDLGDPQQPVPELQAIPSVRIENVRDTVAPDDIIIVAGDDIEHRLAILFDLGLHHVYDGNEMVRRSSPAGRFLGAATGLFVGPVPPVDRDPGAAAALRSCAAGIRARQVPRHKLFVVNSMPKSGTLWMIGMLAKILGIEPRKQLIVSHVADIEVDWPKFNNHGAVMLVRDMRDVVVSWFHDAARTDLRIGFGEPRYRSIDEFYWEYFVATMSVSERYYHGNLRHWIDRNCSNYVPLVRYEDLRADALTSVCRVLNAWRVAYDRAEAAQVCKEFSFDTQAAASHAGDDYVSRMFRGGHLRRGTVGGWRSELPLDISTDIERRFADYQERLGYAPGQACGAPEAASRPGGKV